MAIKCGCYAIAAEKLIEILQTLPPGSAVMPNAVGNFKVVSAENCQDYIGYIDLREDTFEVIPGREGT